jgi:hypothetical protein
MAIPLPILAFRGIRPRACLSLNFFILSALGKSSSNWGPHLGFIFLNNTLNFPSGVFLSPSMYLSF